MGRVPLMPPDGVASTPAQRGHRSTIPGPYAERCAVCQGRAVSRRCGLADPVAAVCAREVGPPAGTVAQRDGPGRSLARRRRGGHTSPARAPEHRAGDWGRRHPAPRVGHAGEDGPHRGGRHRARAAPVGGAVCRPGRRLWPRGPGLGAGLAGLRPPVAGRPHGHSAAAVAPRSGGRGAAAPGGTATGRRPADGWRRRLPGRARGRGRRDGDRGAGRWRVCHGRPGPPAGGSRARGRPRWRGCPAPGVAPAVAHAHGGAGRSPRAPAAEAPLRGAVAAPGPRAGLAGLAGRHPTAGCPASAAPGGAAPGASQRAGGPAGGAAGSPAAAGPPADACPQAHRPAQAVARRRTAPDRRRDARRACHATTARARLAGRAMARPGHGHPSGARLRRDQPARVAPCDARNGVQSHPNWVHHRLMASSLGGLRHCPQIPLAPDPKSCERHNPTRAPNGSGTLNSPAKNLALGACVGSSEKSKLANI